MDNFYLIDKPLEISSFDIIRKLRKKFQIKKMWHTWTLDPLATGGMLIALWSYTKLIPYLEKETKEYEFIINLDWTTTSLDLAEKIEYISEEEQKKAKINISKNQIQKLINNYFIWEITQIPPKYSAIKIDWKRAYALSRQWKEVKMKSRKITIFENEIISFNYPELKLRAKVSAGTYIRTIAWDLWEKLWTGWYLSYLRRIKIWKLDISDAIKLEEISIDDSILVKKVLDKNYFLENFDENHQKRLDDWLERIAKFDLEIDKPYFIFDWKKVTNVVQYDWKILKPLKKII